MARIVTGIFVLIAMVVSVATCAVGNPDFARRMAACEDRGAEVLAGVVANPRDEAITKCSRSVTAFGPVD